MEKSEFNDYFAVLGKASDQSRNVLYVFIIVYIAMLLYGLNAFVYPQRQFNYDLVYLQARCLYQPPPKDAKCETPEIQQFLAGSKLPPPPEENLEKNLWNHQLASFYDASVAVRTFKFPIFGWETDRDLLWLIFPLIGMITYYILRLALSRTVEMFRFLLNRNRTDAMRLRLIQSTVPLGDEHGGVMRFDRAIGQVLTLFVLAIPIIISLLTIFDLTNAIPAIRDQIHCTDNCAKFVDQFLNRWPAPSGGHEGSPQDGSIISVLLGLLSKLSNSWLTLELVFQVIVVALQLALFVSLVTLSRCFGRYQKEAGHLIAALEADAPARALVAL